MSGYIIEEKQISENETGFFTQEDKKIAYAFLETVGLLPKQIGKQIHLDIEIKPNEIVMMLYKNTLREKVLRGLSKVFGKPLKTRQPFEKYCIDSRGRLLSYNPNEPNEPTQIDATNYHAYRACYNQDHKTTSISKEK